MTYFHFLAVATRQCAALTRNVMYVAGCVPSDAAVRGRMDDGDEVLGAGGAAGRGAQVRRAQDLRR